MDPFKRLRALTQYPDWHRKPLRLSRAEMENPYLVLEEFFNLYNLHNLRVCLRQWLRDALYSEREEVTEHFDTCEHMEKLAEAAWQLWNRREATEAQRGECKVDKEQRQDRKEEAPEGEAERKRFAKRWMLDGIKEDPTAFIRKVFRTISPRCLQEVLTVWRTQAFSSETGCYEEAGERKDLLDYTDQLCRLVEACFALGRISFWKERSEIDINRAAGLQPDLLQAEHRFQLTREELYDPLQVVQEFFKMFSLSYARAELWDLLDSALTCEGGEKDHLNLLVHYQCFSTLVEAASHLHKAEGE